MVSPSDLADLDVPALVVRGALANPAMVAITDGLAAALPDVRTAVVDGASHFLITSHPDACAEHLGAFFEEVVEV